MSYFTKFRFVSLLCALVLALVAAPTFADDNTVVITANPESGWGFNLESPYITPAGFSNAAASIGVGSIHVDPITNETSNNAKFILRYVPESPISLEDFENFSIDFLVDDSDASQVEQFYVNLYTSNGNPNDGSWYDCRFDYLAPSGSTSTWTALAFAASDNADSKADQLGGTCPSSPAGMPSGSSVLFFSVNLGDTSGNDSSVGGYFDNAQVTVDGSTTIFDFEPYKVAKTQDDCKKDGWQSVTRADGSSFPNQGKCIQYVNTGK